MSKIINKFSTLFSFRKEVTKIDKIVLSIIGCCMLYVFWQYVHIKDDIIPSPLETLQAFSPLYNQDDLLKHIGFSMFINIAGYLKAILYAIPIGFIIGLLPIFRYSFEWFISALRFLAIGTLTYVFMRLYGIGVGMKINFLCFGVVIYLISAIIQRIDEVEQVHLDTLKTLGGKKIHFLRYVFWPSVMGKFIDDIRILTPITWTYITTIEVINMEGGLGALIYQSIRAGRLDKVFAILVITLTIAILQDLFMRFIDKQLFPYKYV